MCLVLALFRIRLRIARFTSSGATVTPQSSTDMLTLYADVCRNATCLMVSAPFELHASIRKALLKRPAGTVHYLLLDRAAALLATAGEASALPAAVGGDFQLGPQPPCGMEPIPPYPSPENSTVVKSWGRSALGRDWKPPSCTGWTQVGFTSLVSIAARFQYEHGPEGLLRHVGAISELATHSNQPPSRQSSTIRSGLVHRVRAP